MVIQIWKEYGETMTEVLTRAVDYFNEKAPATYAGRLDPAATGIVVILTGEDRYSKDLYLKCKKRYSFEMLAGISTDTGDIFGIIDKVKTDSIIPQDFEHRIRTMTGTHINKLPQYSGYRHNGLPLWQHTLKGKTHVIEKSSTIFSFESITRSSIPASELLDRVNYLTQRQNLQNFRISEIQQSWQQVSLNTIFDSIHISATVSSGTYIRTLVEHIGSLFGFPALAHMITRTAIELPCVNIGDTNWVSMEPNQCPTLYQQ